MMLWDQDYGEYQAEYEDFVGQRFLEFKQIGFHVLWPSDIYRTFLEDK